MTALYALSLLLLGNRTPGEEKAGSCVEQLVADSARAGWALRTQRTRTLPAGVINHFIVQLFESTRYRFVACGEDERQLVRFAVFDDAAVQVAQSEGYAAQAILHYVPTRTASYFIGVQTIADDPEAQVAVGFAVTYR